MNRIGREEAKTNSKIRGKEEKTMQNREKKLSTPSSFVLQLTSPLA